MCKWIVSIGFVFFQLFFTSTSIASDTQAWTAFFTNGAFKESSKLLYWFDGHARYSEDVSRLGVSILRPGFGYKLNKRLSLWAGYAYVVSRADGRSDIDENRFWQQATYKIANANWGSLSGRTRLEQRFLNTGDNTGHRVRQFFRYSKPINNTQWTATAWNETFIAINDTDFGAEEGYDQNRSFIGMRWRPSSSIAFEGGYLLNHIRVSGGSDSLNHNFALGISASF